MSTQLAAVNLESDLEQQASMEEMAKFSPWKIGACPICIALSMGSFVPLLKSFIVIQLSRFMSPELAELMSEADDPIAYLKFKAGDIIIRKFLGDTFADIWGVVSNFLGEDVEPEELK